jgi:hypothetical protein
MELIVVGLLVLGAAWLLAWALDKVQDWAFDVEETELWQ